MKKEGKVGIETEGRQTARRRQKNVEAMGEEDGYSTSVTSEEPGAISGGFCAPFKNASYGGCREGGEKG